MCVVPRFQASISPLPSRNENAVEDCRLNITTSWAGTTPMILYSCSCNDGTASTSFFGTQYDTQACFFNMLSDQQGSRCVKWELDSNAAEAIQEIGIRNCELCGGGQSVTYQNNPSYRFVFSGAAIPSGTEPSFCYPYAVRSEGPDFISCHIQVAYDETNTTYAFPFFRYGCHCGPQFVV